MIEEVMIEMRFYRTLVPPSRDYLKLKVDGQHVELTQRYVTGSHDAPGGQVWERRSEDGLCLFASLAAALEFEMRGLVNKARNTNRAQLKAERKKD